MDAEYLAERLVCMEKFAFYIYLFRNWEAPIDLLLNIIINLFIFFIFFLVYFSVNID